MNVLSKHLVLVLLIALAVAAFSAVLSSCSAPPAIVTPDVAAVPQAAQSIPPGDYESDVLEDLSDDPIEGIQPTHTPDPDEDVPVGELPIGRPGEYVNVTFGYRLQYPQEWFTRFGNRPVVASFSNLNPGVYNRLSMRGEGCLIEVNAGTNVYGLSLQDLMAQAPKSFAGATEVALGGLTALRVPRSDPENSFDGEWVYVQHDGRLIGISFEYARDRADICLPAWEGILASWQWFDPDFTVYRNPTYGYAIAYPRRWFAFNGLEDGITISSLDPSGAESVVELVVEGILVHTTIFENPQDLPLKDWIVANEGDFDLTNDIDLDLLRGVRAIRNEPGRNIQEMTGYFQGPLGRIYVVTTVYPKDRQWEFRPIANAIIYSFTF